MVGHTGHYEPTVHACEATDKAVHRVLEACKKHGVALFITADHGNAEKMVAGGTIVLSVSFRLCLLD